MVNRFIILLILFSCKNIVSAQININFDSDCLNHNSAILSKMLMEAKGEEFLSDLLDENISFLLFCDVDSSGYVVEIKKIHGKKEAVVKVENTIKSLFEEFHTPFYICYEKPLGLTRCEAYRLVTSDFFKEEKTYHLINVGFPGHLMSLYQYEQEKGKEKGFVLTKCAYLISQINKYCKNTLEGE